MDRIEDLQKEIEECKDAIAKEKKIRELKEELHELHKELLELHEDDCGELKPIVEKEIVYVPVYVDPYPFHPFPKITCDSASTNTTGDYILIQ